MYRALCCDFSFQLLLSLSPSAFGRTRKPIYNLNRCDKFDVVNCNESLFSLSSCCWPFFVPKFFWKISRVGNNVSICYQENALTRIKIWIEISKHAFFILNFSHFFFYRKTFYLFLFLFHSIKKYQRRLHCMIEEGEENRKSFLQIFLINIDKSARASNRQKNPQLFPFFFFSFLPRWKHIDHRIAS